MHHCRRFFILLCSFFLITLSASAQPVQLITMLAPGENSVVISPIEVSARVVPGEDDLIRVTLVDEDHTLLARQLLSLDASGEQAIEFSIQLAFEIPVDTHQAILTVATQDREHRPLALRSVTLTLAGSGTAAIQPAVRVEPWLTLTQPEPGEVIRSSPMIIAGMLVPVNNTPVIFELVNERGGSLVSKQLAVETPGKAVDFEISLVYPPDDEAQNLRLVVRQSAGWPGVDVILDSLLITITP